MMLAIFQRSFIIATAVVFAASAQAQVAGRPTPDQAKALLASNPELVQQLRQKLLSSGLSKDQIHARLKAEGYPEDLLDAYIGGAEAGAAPTGEAFTAMKSLSADTVQATSIKAMRDSAAARDSAARREAFYALRGDRGIVRADIADSVARLDSGYNIFGLDVFRSSVSRFEPNLSGPIDANYRLGPGDQLVLILTGDVEGAYDLAVTREGFVVVPQVGQLYVANLTLAQLDDLLYARLGRVYSGVRRGPGATTRFSVSVSRLRSNQVLVLGEVERPGSYLVSSAGTALTALYAAGGPTASGSTRNVQVKRGDRVVGVLDLYDYLVRGDASKDARLETGDIVFVPPQGTRVRIVGEVVRPATFELRPGETLLDLVQDAGGFRADASHRRVQIERILPPGQRSVEGRDRVTLEIEPQYLAATRLESGDVVRVFRVSERLRSTIAVRGNVWSPGTIGLAPGMTIRDAIRQAGGPKPDVYLGQLLVSRLRPDSSRIQMRAAFADSTGTIIGDFPLQEDDVIEVFSLTDFRPVRYVSIGGAVRSPGRFPYRPGITMRDLVLLAGGVTESAYLREAEIARLPDDRTGTATAVTIRAPLDSTYLFDRRPGQPYFGAPGIQAPSQGAPEFELKPYDNVLILQQPNWELQRIVTIAGEVRFPGQYALKTRSERISDLIERAGGLTTEAYAEGTVFVRKKSNVGRVAIDVPRAIRRKGSPDNLQLMDGDEITIPQRSNVVTVRGAVNAPNVVAYVEGQDIDYYIDQAGGVARNADARHAFITQPSGKRETKRRLRPTPKPLPGSLVEVPTIDPAYRTSWLAIAAQVTPVLASLVTLIVALR